MSHPRTASLSAMLALALLAASPLSPAGASDRGSSRHHGNDDGARASYYASVALAHTYTVREVEVNHHYVFQPATLRIHRGDTVRWLDRSDAGHNIVGLGAAAATIHRSDVSERAYTVTFRRAGTYHYACQVHPGMTGAVVVKG